MPTQNDLEGGNMKKRRDQYSELNDNTCNYNSSLLLAESQRLASYPPILKHDIPLPALLMKCACECAGTHQRKQDSMVKLGWQFT